MNLFIVIIPILFQILIVILAGLAWFSFMKNILGGSNRNRKVNQHNKSERSHSMNRSGMQTSQRKQAEMTRTGKNTVTSQRSRSQRPLIRSTSSPSLNAKNLVENLFKQTPQELYRLLVNNLPERYHNEVKAIFNSQSWKKNLWSFVRRKDIWPLLQDALKSEVTEQMDQVSETKTYPRNVQKSREKVSPMETSEDTIFENDFEKDYDSFSKMYDDISDSLTLDSLFPVTEDTLVVSEQQRKKDQKITINKKWLKNAILSKEILERQNY